MVSPAWVRILRRGAPRTIWVIVAVAAVTSFALAWWTFGLPMTYCDSDGWAPSYLETLLHRTLSSRRPRGWVVPAYLDFLGALSIWLRAPNLIGLCQAASLAIGLSWMSVNFVRCATIAEVILAPAVVFSAARTAVHSQTILSEPLVIVLSIPVWLALLQDHISWRHGALLGAVTAILLGARIDTAYLVPLLLARLLWLRDADRLRIVAITAGSLLAVLIVIAAIEEPPRAGQHSVGKVMVLAEWMRYTLPPQNAIAQVLDSDLIERFVPLVHARPRRNIYEGYGDALKVYETYPTLGWGAVARMVTYECVNRPWAVFTDRLRALADLYATAYAWAWPEYKPWSSLYVSHDMMVGSWSVQALEQPDPHCPLFAKAQATFYGRSRIRSESSLRALQFLHQVARPYAIAVLRPLLWLAPPVCGFLLWRRRDATYGWLTAIIVTHLALRGFLIGVDERYQLPIDLLMIWWLALTIRQLTSTVIAKAHR